MNEAEEKSIIWVQFAENGSMEFWTSDANRAIEESFCHARPLVAYYLKPPSIRDALSSIEWALESLDLCDSLKAREILSATLNRYRGDK